MDRIVQYDEIITHSSENVVIALTSWSYATPTASTKGSWGFRDFKVFIISCPANCLVCDIDNMGTCAQWQSFAAEFTNSTNFGVVGWVAQGGVAKPTTSNCGGV